MERAQATPTLTGTALRNLMFLSGVFPVVVTILAGKVMVEDHLWAGLLTDILGLLCLWVANAGLFHLWKSVLSEAERQKINARIPILVVFGAALAKVSTAGQALPPCPLCIRHFTEWTRGVAILRRDGSSRFDECAASGFFGFRGGHGLVAQR